MAAAKKLVDVAHENVYKIRDAVRRAGSSLHNLRQGLESGAIPGNELTLRLVKEAEAELNKITD